MNAQTAAAVEKNKWTPSPEADKEPTFPIAKNVTQFRAVLADLYVDHDKDPDNQGFSNTEFEAILNHLFTCNVIDIPDNAKKPTSVAFIRALNPDTETWERVLANLDDNIDLISSSANDQPEPVAEEPIIDEPTEPKAKAKAKDKKRAADDLEPTDGVNGLVCKDRKTFRTRARAWCRKYDYNWDIVNGVYIVDRSVAKLPVIYVFYDEDAKVIEWTETPDNAIEIERAIGATSAKVEETLNAVDELLAEAN